MRQFSAKFWSVLLTVGLLAVGPSCSCAVSEAEAAELPSATGVAGTDAVDDDGDCCSDDGSEHGESDHECCGCDGHSTQTPRSPADLGIGVVAKSNATAALASLPTGADGASAPWTLDRFRRSGAALEPSSTESRPSNSSSLPRYLHLQVLRL